MARLTRVHQKVFASNASNNGVFGSLQAGNPTTSNDVATLQSLSAFENGWDDAAYSGDKLPPLEEFQGIQYGISYQQAYMLQEGIAEWNASTPYYKGSLTKTISGSSFKLYCSLTDNNTGNITTNTTYWKKVMDSDDVYAFDSAVVHLAGTETITGDKTFSGSVSLGSSATATTPAASDNSTKVATTAWLNLADVKSAIVGWIMPNLANKTKISSDSSSSGSYTPTSNGWINIYAHGNNRTGVVKVGGVDVYSSSYDANYGDTDNCWVPVPKGVQITWTKNSSSDKLMVYFIPCVGG